VSAALLAVLRTVLALQCVSKARGWTGHVARWLVPSLLLTAIAGVRLSPYEYNVEVLAPRCCCAALCCVAVLFSTPSLPRVLLLVTALSLSVVVRVLREGARVTWVYWCWLLCCRFALVLSPSSQSLVCRGYHTTSSCAPRPGWPVRYARATGASARAPV
jgi:hypothetical protein